MFCHAMTATGIFGKIIGNDMAEKVRIKLFMEDI